MKQSQDVSSCGQLPSKKPVLQTSQDILQLSPDMLVSIFQKLCTADKGRVAQVCRDWRDVAYQPVVWRHLVAEVSLDEKVNPFLIPGLAKRDVSKVKVTDLSGHRLCDLMEGVPNLTKLDLKGCEGLDDRTIFSAFSKERLLLKYLNMEKCQYFKETSVALFTMKFKNLDFLSLVDCHQLADTSLLLIARGLLRLKTLHLGSNDLITDKGIGHLSGIDGHKANDRCQLLCLSLCRFNQLTNRSLKYLSKGQTNLKSLYLQLCCQITAKGVGYMTKIATLNYLCLNGNNFGNGAMLPVSAGRSSIETLSIWNNSCLTAVGVFKIGEMVHLQCLHFHKCSEINDACLHNLAKQRSRITVLQIHYCENITNKGLGLVAKLPCLVKLELQSDVITSDGLVSLAVRESKIKNLNLTGCKAINSYALRIISYGLFSMQILTLDENHVSDVGMALAARTLGKLISLVCGGAELIGEIVKIRKA